MSKQGISLRVDDKSLQEIDRLAALSKRDRTFIINEAIEAYLEVNNWQLDHIEQSLAQAERGEFTPESEVEKVFKKWR